MAELSQKGGEGGSEGAKNGKKRVWVPTEWKPEITLEVLELCGQQKIILYKQLAYHALTANFVALSRLNKTVQSTGICITR